MDYVLHNYMWDREPLNRNHFLRRVDCLTLGKGFPPKRYETSRHPSLLQGMRCWSEPTGISWDETNKMMGRQVCQNWDSQALVHLAGARSSNPDLLVPTDNIAGQCDFKGSSHPFWFMRNGRRNGTIFPVSSFLGVEQFTIITNTSITPQPQAATPREMVTNVK